MADSVSVGGLVDLVDRLLSTGVVVAGQVTIRLADIDLVDLDARLLLTGVEAERERLGLRPTSTRDDTPSLPATNHAARVLPERLDAERPGEDGIARLVLLVVEMLRQVLTSQALARLEGGSLRNDEIERLGRALMLLEQRCEALRDFLTTSPSWLLPPPPLDRSVHA